MNGPADLLDRVRGVNPVPNVFDAAQPGAHESLLTLIDERKATPAPERAPGSWIPNRTAVRYALGAALLLIVAIVVVMLFGSPDDAAPDVIEPPPTTLAEPSLDPHDLIGVFETAINDSDLDAALATLSNQSVCDIPIPGSRTETCEDFWASNIGIGAHIELTCPESEPPFTCSLALQSEAHAALGFSDHRLTDPASIDVDTDGRLILVPRLNPNRPFLGENETDVRMWALMEERYPDMSISSIFGPNPYDGPSGVAILETARVLNDPQRIVAELQRLLGEGGDADVLQAVPSAQCDTGIGRSACLQLVAFALRVDATIQFDCGGRQPSEGVLVCPVSVTSQVHQALGSGPTTSEAEIEFRGGAVRNLAFALAFSDDPQTNTAFLDAARAQEALFDEQAVLTGQSADAWISLAREFSSSAP